MQTALAEGQIVYGAFLPGGLDPDEFLSQDAPLEKVVTEMRAILAGAKALLDLRIDQAIVEAKKDSDLKTHALKTIAGWLNYYADPVGRSVRVSYVAKHLGLSENWLKEMFGQQAGTRQLERAPSRPPAPSVKTKKVDRLLSAERLVLCTLLFWKEFCGYWSQLFEGLPAGTGPDVIFDDLDATKLTEYVFFTQGKLVPPFDPEWDIAVRLGGYLSQNPDSPLSSLLARAEIEGLGRFMPQEVEFAFASLILKAWVRFSHKISKDLALAESRKDAVLQDKLLKDYLDVQRKIKELSRLYDKNDRTHFDPEV